MLQVYGLVPILSARENVSIALRARGVKPADADERAEAALARFHIADLGDRQVEELSGGQMQRVACARGLVVGADVLLADEPTSELDEGNRSLVLAELRAEAARGAVVVVATHDPAVVDACDRHYALDEGRLTDHVAAVDLARSRGPSAGSSRRRSRRTSTRRTSPSASGRVGPSRPPSRLPTGPSRSGTGGGRAAPDHRQRRGVPPAPDRRERPCMNRTLRGAWSRRGTLLPLLLLTVVVVAGAVTVHRVRRPGGHLAAARRTPPAARRRRRPRHRPGARQRPPHRDRDRPAARPAGRRAVHAAGRGAAARAPARRCRSASCSAAWAPGWPAGPGSTRPRRCPVRPRSWPGSRSSPSDWAPCWSAWPARCASRSRSR